MSDVAPEPEAEVVTQDGEVPDVAAEATEPIVETAKVDPNVDAEQPAGFPHGHIVKSVEGLFERIVHDFDEEGKLLGWHKEPAEAPAEDAATP
jgi:hypothetical protein